MNVSRITLLVLVFAIAARADIIEIDHTTDMWKATPDLPPVIDGLSWVENGYDDAGWADAHLADGASAIWSVADHSVNTAFIRGTFDLQGTVQSGVFSAAADDVAWYYLNGAYFGTSPGNDGTGGWASFDISSYLVQGSNTFAIQAQDGNRTFAYNRGGQGVVLDIDIETASVPEPSVLILLTCGVLGAVVALRRK